MKLISFQNIDKLWFFGLKESFILIIVLASLQEEDEIVKLKWSLRKATATARRVPEISAPAYAFFFFNLSFNCDDHFEQRTSVEVK